jgi:hypothetical protein
VYTDEYQMRVVFMVMGGVPGGFMEGRETAKVALGHTWDVALKIHPTWDAVRIEYLRRWTTRPPSTATASASDDPRVPLLAWIDFWSGDTTGPPWWFDLPLHDFNHSLSVMASYAQRVLVLGDVPTVPIEKVVHDDRLRKFANAAYKRNGNWDFLVRMKEDVGYKGRRERVEATIDRTARRLSAEGGDVRYLEVASYFIEQGTGILQLVDPTSGGLVYQDFGHLNTDGSGRLEQLFRKEIFGQHICAP